MNSRTYYGDINGKFWFGIQDTKDAENFGVEAQHKYYYLGCECILNEIEKLFCACNECITTYLAEQNNKAFCERCYSSFEDHKIKSTTNKPINENDECVMPLIYRSKNEMHFSFRQIDFATAKRQLLDLEEEYGQYITLFEITNGDEDEENSYIVEYHVNEPYEARFARNIARICLGRQIVYCLEHRGVCNFTIESRH